MHINEKVRDGNDLSIKELRLHYGITQVQLSEITGIPKRTISNWETGERTPAPYITSLISAKLELEFLRSKE
ncbi:MAG: helix-turn-helix transcriptional regulator [Ruminiclostridium sp.]|uniref:helix-turn-helix domain-containing protein n=1 Tax=Ruminococcus sp. TaxID=41978 RepID=UPI001B55AE56|nr:helix-turn-helix transcriptional regulator [Ruminococcus sp.]MBP3854044.1 helix-turn-helix transcriptional regulator [Ruminiclostridium sp.]MBR1433239.1 helix-turn-helix transcriptional regulator [Ruminococcus sp.]